MSPTLLELVVTVLVIWMAWRIGAWIAPRIVASFVSFWRGPRPSGQDTVAPDVSAPSSHGRLLPPK